ncbi:MAG: Gfo/Idh/MocA family protein, partial [Bacteroidota bacterium]
MNPKNIAMLGSGFIGDFYTASLHRPRSQDRVKLIYSRNEDKAKRFAEKWSVPHRTTNLEEAVTHPEIDTVVIALSNDMHLEAARLAAKAGKAVLCTKPLGRNAEEAGKMLEAVEEAGVFHGYLEDLVYTHKTLKALASVRNGAVGRVFWVRSRETHPGPHSDWFWTPEISGGGVILDMGCHCIEIARNFI